MSQTDINLAPGEKGLYSVSFRPNLVLFWLRSTFLVTNRRIAVKTPNTIFGVIPLGFQENSMPMGSVAGVNASLSVKVGRFIGFGLLSLLLLTFSFAGGFNFFLFLLGLVCVALAANGILAGLQIQNNGGGISEATVSILDKAALERFKEKANEYIYSSTTAGTSWNDSFSQGNQGGNGGSSPYMGGPQYGNGGPQYGNGGPQYGNGGPQYGNGSSPYGNGSSPYGNGSSPYGQNSGPKEVEGSHIYGGGSNQQNNQNKGGYAGPVQGQPDFGPV